MKKMTYLALSLLFVLFAVGCENKDTNIENNTNNNEQKQQEEVKKESKVSCSGPMVGNMFSSIDEIVDDKMTIYATYDSEEELQGVFYDYDFIFNTEFKGKALEELKSGFNKICENKLFSDCNVNVDGKKATIHTELDTTEMKKSGKYDKEAFKKEIKTLGDNWTCVEE